MTDPTQSIQELREQLMNRAGLLRVIDHIVLDRLEAAESRVAELEDRLYGTGTTKYDRIEALEAAQVPRDMADTPSSGVKFWAIVQLRYHKSLSEMEGFRVLLDDEDFTWVDGEQARFIGWLPLPDQQGGATP